MTLKTEYEIIRYPKINHVKFNMVQIIYRNPHLHRELELCLVLDGKANVWVRNQKFTVEKGSLIFFNSNEPHEISSLDQNSVRIAYIQIANNFCHDYFPQLRNLELLENNLTSCLKPKQNEQLTALMLSTIRAYMDTSELHTLKCLDLVCQLVLLILDCVPYRQLEEAAYLTRKKTAARLQRITEYIDTHYNEKMSLAEIATQEKITITYLSHFIHENLNVTFQEYVNNIRFEKALKLISNSHLCLLDVCLSSGFSDLRYLNKMFEKRFGCSPKAYRYQVICDNDLRSQDSINQDFVSEEMCCSWLNEFINTCQNQNNTPDI